MGGEWFGLVGRRVCSYVGGCAGGYLGEWLVWIVGRWMGGWVGGWSCVLVSG